jgi:hypothetical protein
MFASDHGLSSILQAERLSNLQNTLEYFIQIRGGECDLMRGG